MRRTILGFISFLVFASSCNKCDEFSPGDCKDCYEKLAGDWTLDYLATNGIDSVAYYDSLFAMSCLITFKPYEKGNDGQGFIIAWGDTSENYFFQGGKYSHIDEKENLIIYTYGVAEAPINSNPFSAWFPIPQSSNPRWKMRKLSDTELWFELDQNGNIYEIHLIR